MIEDQQKTALYAGSFDPLTNGHLDIIQRAASIFDKVVICVAVNSSKNSLFSLKERETMIQQACDHLDNIEIVAFSGLLIDAVEKHSACAVIRGLRSVSDFEYESAMAMMNRRLSPLCETVFLMPSPELSFVSSRMIREIASYNGDISSFVPAQIAEKLKKRLSV